MTALRIALLLVAAGLTYPTASLVVQMTPSDGMWWAATILVGGAWCGWSLAWDETSRRMGRRKTTPRRGA